MAGFALVYETDSTAGIRENDFQNILQLTAYFKRLDLPGVRDLGQNCSVAKLDAASSIHKGIARDEQTGSWLLATGTLVTLMGNNDPTKQLDTILQDYLEHGVDFLKHYDGHFALAIYDGRDQSLEIISDPTGQFSIFYATRGNKTYISTSALAIARIINAQPDDLILENFLRTGKILKDRTPWRNVKRVLPARILRFDHNKVDEVEYWAPAYNESIARLSLDDSLDCATILLTNTFKIIFEREGKVWTDLTGGMDTRFTTMWMDKLGLPFIAYCVGPADHPDVKISRFISQEMGWEYCHMPMPDNWAERQFEWLETALHKGDASLSVPQLATVLYGQQERSKTFKVNVTGLGADEWRTATFPSAYLFNWGKTYNYDRLIDANVLSSNIPVSILRQDREKYIREEWRAYLAEIASNYTQYPNVTQGNLMFIRYRYPSHGGVYQSATAGIMRTLSPFFFKELVNFGFSLDFKWRLNYHYHFVRTLMEKENPALTSIEIAKGGPATPIRLSNIHRFWPLLRPFFERNTKRISHKVFGRSIKLPGEQHPYSSYPLPSWGAALLDYSLSDNLLRPSEMLSGSLYNPDSLQALVAQAEKGYHKHGEFLDRVISLEMALRAAGRGLD